MATLLLTLGLGVGLIVVANLLLFRFNALNPTQNAVIVAAAALGIYLPLAVLNWPGADLLAVHIAVYVVSSYACGMGLSARARAQAQGRRSGWHWGPAGIVGFFVVLAAVDSVFIVIAERGLSPSLSDTFLPASSDEVSFAFPGVVSHDFHEKEALFNAYLRRLEQQRQRGWQVRKGWLEQPQPHEPAVFQIVARTREGAPVQDASVSGRFLRPSDSRLDIAFTMQETAPGTYQVQLTLPAAGRWDLALQLQKERDIHEIRARTSVAARSTNH